MPAMPDPDDPATPPTPIIPPNPAMPPIPAERREHVRRQSPGFARAVARARRADAEGQGDAKRDDEQGDERDALPVPAETGTSDLNTTLGPAATVVLTSLDAFRDDPALLYACLWLARTDGVGVTFAPAP